MPPSAHPPLPLDPDAASGWLADGARVLDVRDEAAFASGHRAGAGRMGIDEFEARRHELPSRETPLLVVHDRAEEAAAAAVALHALGYLRLGWLDAPLASLPGGLAARGAAARLWSPSPFLERVAPLLPAAGRVLDLAAGSGREAVWMAARGYEVEAWDRAPEALDRARALAAREGVSLRTRIADLEGRALPDPGPHDVVLVFRFLHRPILGWIARAVAPGGMLVYETFAKGQERHGRPRHPRFLFHPGEIVRAFEGLRPLIHEEPQPEGGPVLARLLACRDA